VVVALVTHPPITNKHSELPVKLVYVAKYDVRIRKQASTRASVVMRSIFTGPSRPFAFANSFLLGKGRNMSPKLSRFFKVC
jgi:hypothetical protein